MTEPSKVPPAEGPELQLWQRWRQGERGGEQFCVGCRYKELARIALEQDFAGWEADDLDAEKAAPQADGGIERLLDFIGQIRGWKPCSGKARGKA